MSDVQNRKKWFKIKEMSIRDQRTKIQDEQERMRETVKVRKEERERKEREKVRLLNEFILRFKTL